MKLIKVKLLINTNKNKINDVRELNSERAEAWVKIGWAEYIEKPNRRLKGINIKDITGCRISKEESISYENLKPVGIKEIKTLEEK